MTSSLRPHLNLFSLDHIHTLKAVNNKMAEKIESLESHKRSDNCTSALIGSSTRDTASLVYPKGDSPPNGAYNKKATLAFTKQEGGIPHSGDKKVQVLDISAKVRVESNLGADGYHVPADDAQFTPRNPEVDAPLSLDIEAVVYRPMSPSEVQKNT